MTQAPSTTTTMSVPEFSEHIGCKRTYAYQLKKEGRLVLTDDSKMVKVAESIARIAATRDPAHQGVADRHAAERGAPAQTGHAANADPAPPVGEGSDAPVPSYDFQSSKAKREHWAAEREHADYRKAAGELMEHTEHIAAMAHMGATVRAALEGWANMLPPQLVGLDESAIRTTLIGQVEHILSELTAQARNAAQTEE